MGKTSLLEQIIYQQMQQQEAIIVIDQHGDLVNSIVAHMPESKLEKTYLLDLKDRDYPFGLSVFACQNPEDEEARDTTRNQIMHAFEKLWPETKEGQYFKKILRHIVIALIENPGLTLAHVRRFLLNESYRQQYTLHLQNSETRSFWMDEYNRLTESKRITLTNPFLNRLDELLTEPVMRHLLQQTTKTVDIRELIEEGNILLVKLPVNEEAYKYSSPVTGILIMAMIYAAIFSFADVPLEERPGCTLVVDEFQNFATDEYAKLFEQGRKYGIKQFLAHQHRQQFERAATGKTNLAATLSAHTTIAFRTIPSDSRELVSLFSGIAERRRPTNIDLNPLSKLDKYPSPIVREFSRDVIKKLEGASKMVESESHLWKEYEKFKKEYYRSRWYRGKGEHRPKAPLDEPRFYSPINDFGYGYVSFYPGNVSILLNRLNLLLYESQKAGRVREDLRDAVLGYYLVLDEKTKQVNLTALTKQREGDTEPQPLTDQERAALTWFAKQLDEVLAILIKKPIADDAQFTTLDIAELLDHQEIRHALMKTGSQAFSIKTRDTRLLQSATTASDARDRYKQIQEQTRVRYCVKRSELDEQQEEKQKEILVEEPELAQQPQPTLTFTELQKPELTTAETTIVPEPEIEQPEPLLQPEPVQQQTEQLPVPHMDTMNSLYAQFKERTIDADTTILASLGEHYVLTIRQWMRLFEWKTYPKATQHFKEQREQGYIYRKDREGRGGSLVTGDWFFLLTKGANELTKRKQPMPPFTLEPNEAERASGDTLFHTFLINEVLIHLRLLEREHPELVRIEQIHHERNMRRAYHTSLGSDTKLYPDGFLRLLVPTPNGLKHRYTFLELQHTTQKDKHNFQAKVRKYIDLFEKTDTLTRFFST